MIQENETISNVLLIIEQYRGNYANFKSAVLAGEHTPTSKHFSRLLVWKTFLITETLNIQAWQDKLTASRAVYHKLRRAPEMTVPWWLLDKDNEFYVEREDSSRGRQKPQRLARIQVNDDPLASSEHEYSDDDGSELLRSIVMDVQRLFPGDTLFDSSTMPPLTCERQLINVLYVWAKCNPQVGYKQGIHEILGLIYKNMRAESFDISNTNTFSVADMQVLSLYNLHYLEHDLFTLFNRFVVSSGVIEMFYQSESLLMAAIENFNVLLMKVDQLIHYNLVSKLRLESQLWIIRFFRLLLLRELGSNLLQPSLLWDKLVAAEVSRAPGQHPIPDLISFSTIIMLIHIKTELALCDFSEALALLLHYPISTRLHLYPNFIDLLFKDAYGLLAVKDKDIKLYESGLKLNKKYSGVLKVVGHSSGESSPRKTSATASPKTSVELPGPGAARKANMAFEKLRMEMRLKKRAQELTQKRPDA